MIVFVIIMRFMVRSSLTTTDEVEILVSCGGVLSAQLRGSNKAPPRF